MLKTWRPQKGGRQKDPILETNLRLFKLLRFHISSQLTSQAAVCGPVFGPRNRTHFWGCGAVLFWEDREQKRSSKRRTAAMISWPSVLSQIKYLLPGLNRNEFLQAQLQGSCSLKRCLTPELQLRRPHVRRGSFGCGLRPLIWACAVVIFSDSYGAARGVGCARNCKVRQAQQLCLETRHGSCGRTS